MEHTREVSLRYCKLLIERKECPKAQSYDRMKLVFDELVEALKALVEYHQKYSGAIPCLVDALAALAHAKALEEK